MGQAYQPVSLVFVHLRCQLSLAPVESEKEGDPGLESELERELGSERGLKLGPKKKPELVPERVPE